MQFVMNDTWLELNNAYQARREFTTMDPVGRCLERLASVVEYKVVVRNCPQEMVVTMQVQNGAVTFCGTGLSDTCREYRFITCDVVTLHFQLLAWGRTEMYMVRKWVIQWPSCRDGGMSWASSCHM